MRLPPNARRFRGRPPVEEDDPLLAYRRAQGQGGTPAPADTADPLARFRQKYSGTNPVDVPAITAESTGTRSPAPALPQRTIAPRVLDAETPEERGLGRASALYQGLTLGLGDKIQAGIKTLLPEFAGGSRGWDFRENLRNARTPLNDYRARHPIESTAAEIVGGLPTVVATAPLSVSARLAQAPRALQIAGLMGEGAVMGGAVGAFDAIQPDATLGDVGFGAAAGAATGGIAAPIVAPLASKVIRGATRTAARFAPDRVADRFAAMMGGEPVTPRGQAKAALTGALESGGVKPGEAAESVGLIQPAKTGPDPILAALDERGIPIASDGTVEVFILGEPGNRTLSLARPKGMAVSTRVPVDQLDPALVRAAPYTGNAPRATPKLSTEGAPAPAAATQPFESFPDLPETPRRIGTEEPERGSRAPAVDWTARDLQDTGAARITPEYIAKTYNEGRGVAYQSYLSADEIPSPKGAGISEEMDAYDWSELQASGRGKSPPPIKVRITPEGKVELLDGNHRVQFWNEQGYDQIPAWVIDERPGIRQGGPVDAAAVQSRLGAGASPYMAGDVGVFGDELAKAGARVSPEGMVQLHYVGTPEEVARFRETGQLADDELLRVTPPAQGETGVSVRVPIEKLDLEYGVDTSHGAPHVALTGGAGTIDASPYFQGRAAAAPAAAAPEGGATPMRGSTANTEIARIADEYRQSSGVLGRELPHPAKVDAERAGTMANAYEALPNDPNDPEVIAAYRALARETRAQAEALMKAGYRPEFMTDDPYKNSAEMMADLANRKTIRVFKTNKENPHPLLTDEENDLFRWVHDVFGHAQSGNQFGALGEERAFRDHASMFSPLARRAMATETRGQNSWVNFGPNRDLPVAQRPYAEQKAALFPRELVGEYGEMPRESPTTMMELGSRQVPALVRAARNVPTSTAAQTTDRFLTERGAGAGKRIERALNEATGHEAGDSWMPVEQLIERRAREARPLYQDAENYGPVKNPETVAQIALLRKHPVFARAWSRGQAMGELEGNPATRKVVTQEAQPEIPRIAPDAPAPAPAPVPSGKPTTLREAIAEFQERPAIAAARTEGTPIQQQARAALERRSAEAELPDAPRRLVGGTLQEPRAAVAEESMQAPTIQQINRWKKGLDAVINSGYGSENAVSREEARLFRQKLNEVLRMVDEEVPAFKQARQNFAGNSELKEASEAGAEHFKPATPTGALARQLGAYTPGELEVYRQNALNKLVEKIRTIATNPDMPEAGRSTNILQRIMGTEDAAERLGMLFPDEASYASFLRQVEDEALYPKTDRFLRNQSTTAAQLAESGTGIQTWADLAKSPFSKSARMRLLLKAVGESERDQKLPKKVADEVGQLATTTGYKLRALLREMAADKAAREAGRRRLLSFSNAAIAGGAAPTVSEAARRRRPEQPRQ